MILPESADLCSSASKMTIPTSRLCPLTLACRHRRARFGFRQVDLCPLIALRCANIDARAQVVERSKILAFLKPLREQLCLKRHLDASWYFPQNALARQIDSSVDVLFAECRL